METIAALLKHVPNKLELVNCMSNFNHDIEHTFQECCEVLFNHNLPYEANHFFKIDSITDFLHEELNTGHWSQVPLSTRRAFSSVSFVKSIIILKNPNNQSSTNIEQALQSIDKGILLGAPLEENEDLLTHSATVLSKALNELRPSKPEIHLDGKRKTNSNHENSYETLKGEEILTLERPSVESFHLKCFQPQIPAKLCACMTHWPASKKWLDMNYLLEVAGDRTVPVEIGSRYTDENWTQELMSLKDFIRRHYLSSFGEVGYLAQHNLFDQITELKEDICIPEYCGLSRDYDHSSDPDINAWFGPTGTVSPLHFDPKDNLLAQVYGTKQILLYSSADSECLYPHDNKLLFNTAEVDVVQPDLTKYPKYSRARPYKCLLEAGDMLYIPIKWWHHITALEKSFSVSFWWQ